MYFLGERKMNLIKCSFCDTLFDSGLQECPCCQKKVRIDFGNNRSYFKNEDLKGQYVFFLGKENLIKKVKYLSMEEKENVCFFTYSYLETINTIQLSISDFIFYSYEGARNYRNKVENPKNGLRKLSLNNISDYQKLLDCFPLTDDLTNNISSEKKHYELIVQVLDLLIKDVRDKLENVKVISKNAYSDMIQCLQEETNLGRSSMSDHYNLTANVGFVRATEAKNEIMVQINNFEKLKKFPYFAHLECGLSKDNIHVIYIGYEEIEGYVVDWRSKVAELYYNSNQLMSKSQIEYSLKRTFTSFDNGNIEYSDEIRTFEPQIVDEIEDEMEFKTHDDVFLNLIKQSRSDFKTHDIIKTLQGTQYQIIVEDYNRNMIVNGCAGSGKTMILYHRLSHIAYNEKKNNLEFNTNNLFVISPSELFQKSMLDLTHVLELDKLRQYTLYQFVENLIFIYSRIKHILPYMYLENEYIFDPNVEKDRYSDENYSSFKDEFQETNIKSLDFRLWFLKYLNEILKTKLSYENVYEKKNGKLTLTIEKIIENERKIEVSKNKVLSQSSYISYFDYTTIEKTVRKETTLKKQSEFLALLKKCKPLMSCFGKKEATIEITPLKKEFMKEPQTLENAYRFLIAKTLLKEYESAISGYDDYFEIAKFTYTMEKFKETLGLDVKKKYFFERVYFLKYLEEKYGPFFSNHSWCFVDEYQNYSFFEMAVIQNAFKNVTMNFYGDLNQKIEEKGIDSIEGLAEKYDDIMLYQLNENYRNAIEITEYINSKLNMHMIPIGIHGVVKEIDLEKTEFEINGRTAIIFKNYDLFKAKCSKINKTIMDNLSLLSIDEVKGLEFETVYVLLDEMTNPEKYLAMSRALNYLIVMK